MQVFFRARGKPSPAVALVVSANPFCGIGAYYAPAEDYVRGPPPQAYFETINWHRTALHKLGHASGHYLRVNRDLLGSFSSRTVKLQRKRAKEGVVPVTPFDHFKP